MPAAPRSKWGKPTHTHLCTHRNEACAHNRLWLGPPWRPPRQGSWTTPSSRLTMSLLPPHTCPEILQTEADTLFEHSTTGTGGRVLSADSTRRGVSSGAHHPPARAQPPRRGHPPVPALQQPESRGHKTEVSRGTEMTVSTADQVPLKRAPPSPEMFKPSLWA